MRDAIYGLRHQSVLPGLPVDRLRAQLNSTRPALETRGSSLHWSRQDELARHGAGEEQLPPGVNARWASGYAAAARTCCALMRG